jgi:hypothetical protein
MEAMLNLEKFINSRRKSKMTIPVWILTYDREEPLNRLIGQLIDEGFGGQINIMSNHPKVKLIPRSADNLNSLIVNSLNEKESTSWCTRSWNSILIKALKTSDNVICFQDDTTINEGFGEWISNIIKEKDFLWGPAGDQFFYLTKSILRTVGWFDERYLACFCGDMDFLRRVWHNYDRSKLIISETHPEGGQLQIQEGAVRKYVNDGDARQKTEWQNQCQQYEEYGIFLPVLKHCQDHYITKWGIPIEDGLDAGPSQSLVPEIDWYPWFTKMFLKEREEEKEE